MAKYVRSLDPKKLNIKKKNIMKELENSLECKCPEAIDGEHVCRAVLAREALEAMKEHQNYKNTRSQLGSAAPTSGTGWTTSTAWGYNPGNTYPINYMTTNLSTYYIQY